MNYLSKLMGLILLLTIFNACAPAVHTDFDRSFDFTLLKNYALLPENQSNTGLAMLDGPLVGKRITQSVNDILQAKGYINTSGPDFYVSYQLGTKTEHGREPGPVYGFGYFGGYYGRGLHGSDFYEEYEKAVLIIRMYRDRNKSVLLWKGISEKKLPDRSTGAKDIDNMIHQMVMRILNKFPPEGKQRIP